MWPNSPSVKFTGILEHYLNTDRDGMSGSGFAIFVPISKLGEKEGKVAHGGGFKPGPVRQRCTSRRRLLGALATCWSCSPSPNCRRQSLWDNITGVEFATRWGGNERGGK